MSSSNSVCLFKSEKKDDLYRESFSKAGFEVHFEPVLDFDFVNEDILSNALFSADSELYDAMVATSPRSFEAIARILSSASIESQSKAQEVWKNRILFAVGDSTVAASPLIFKSVICVSSDALNLGNAIIEHFSGSNIGNKPWKLLFPCSSIRRDLLPSMLSKPELHIELHEITAYATRKLRCQDHQNETKLQWWAFFSPSGVEAVFGSNVTLPTSHLKFAAIGKTTADSLQGLGLPVHAVAAKPTPEDLLVSIQQHDQ